MLTRVRRHGATCWKYLDATAVRMVCAVARCFGVASMVPVYLREPFSKTSLCGRRPAGGFVLGPEIVAACRFREKPSSNCATSAGVTWRADLAAVADARGVFTRSVGMEEWALNCETSNRDWCWELLLGGCGQGPGCVVIAFSRLPALERSSDHDNRLIKGCEQGRADIGVGLPGGA